VRIAFSGLIFCFLGEKSYICHTTTRGRTKNLATRPELNIMATLYE
jgi:hypothetical protein